MTALFSYVIVQDSGFAPNPYGGFLTLATCKPRIRAKAEPGDWIVGTGSVRGVGSNRVVYAAVVSEAIPIDVYGAARAFEQKIPRLSADESEAHGDNIYVRDASGKWKQRRGVHHNQEHFAHDLSGENVLICPRFWYFGSSAPALPRHLLSIVKQGPGHKRITDAAQINALQAWLSRRPVGMSGEPFIGRRRRADAQKKCASA